ncbi:SDR family oxidoreductase, partial [Candidatus Protofrankia californiensis]|uniref:SDR family oxidoreductase n=1 Tax=Candidatus Protofrankia californiensis TaxID=1839754 RepID=UPI001040F7A3
MTDQVPEKSKRDIATNILLRRFGEPEEIASAAVYLSLDTTYCTGSVLTVDGGGRYDSGERRDGPQTTRN